MPEAGVLSVSNPDILTIREVAELLRIGEKTAYTLAQTGKLPGFKVGGQWRFSRSKIEAWIEAQTDKAALSPKDEPQ